MTSRKGREQDCVWFRKGNKWGRDGGMRAGMVQEVAGIRREGRDKGPGKEKRIGTRKDEKKYRDGDETVLEE